MAEKRRRDADAHDAETPEEQAERLHDDIRQLNAQLTEMARDWEAREKQHSALITRVTSEYARLEQRIDDRFDLLADEIEAVTERLTELSDRIVQKKEREA